MDNYLLNEKKELYRKLLRIYDYKDSYKAEEKINYSSLKFIDEYKITDFFISLIDSFDEQHDLTSSMYKLDLDIEKWNNNNPTKKVYKEYMIKKYYLLVEKNKVIINPEIMHGNTLEYTVDMNYISFIKLFLKTTFLYPLFEQEKWIKILEEHNKNLKNELTKEKLLGVDKNLHAAIFHDHQNLRQSFLEALKIKVILIKYEDWKSNIGYYFTLLMEIDCSEIDIRSVIQDMDKNKQIILIKFCIEGLINNNEICKFNNLNFFNRLKYVPYELKDENIYKPAEGSRLIAYNPHYYDELNVFDKLNELENCFGNPQWHFYYSQLFKDSLFIFKNFQDLIKPKQWEEIIDRNLGCNVFLYYLYVNILNKKEKLLEYKSIKIAPLVIEKIINIDINQVNFKKNNFYLLKDDFKIELLEFYLIYISEFSSDYFEFIMDFYFYASREQLRNNKKANLLKTVKGTITKELIKYFNDDYYKDIILKKLKDYKCDDNFYIFDLLSEYKDATIKTEQELAKLIVNKYLELLNGNKFYCYYYSFKGINNLLKALYLIKNDEKYKNKIFINFHQFLDLQADKNKIKWSEYFLNARKLRGHLGILCLLIEKYGWDDAIADYILEIFKLIKIKKNTELNPLSWKEIVEPQWGNDILKNQEILSLHIAKILKKKDNNYKNTYLKAIESSLCYCESILYNKILDSNNVIVKELDEDIKGIGTSVGVQNAYFLLNNGYPEEALKYVKYVEKENRIQLKKDLIRQIKYYCLINIGYYNKALEIVNEIEDKSKKIPQKATVYYFMKDYGLAKQLFEKYFDSLDNNEPDIGAIVNYSAVLISLNMDKAAIQWCEKYIEKYQEDYLLNANLACAYSKIDNVKSLYYFNEAQKKNSEYIPAAEGVMENINNIIANLPSRLNLINEFNIKGNFAKEFTEKAYETIKQLSPISIPDHEITILKSLNAVIQGLSEKPMMLEKLSENEISDIIEQSLKGYMDNYAYEVTREAPHGYAVKKPGEVDLFIYESGEKYRNIAIGENKIWGQDKFKKQMGQLFGYLREDGGFGFTIIINKKTKLQTVLNERRVILEGFYFEDDSGNKVFERVDSIVDMKGYFEDFNGVILTLHKNPEVDKSCVRIYHFILNVSREKRKNIAKQVRKK